MNKKRIRKILRTSQLPCGWSIPWAGVGVCVAFFCFFFIPSSFWRPSTRFCQKPTPNSLTSHPYFPAANGGQHGGGVRIYTFFYVLFFHRLPQHRGLVFLCYFILYFSLLLLFFFFVLLLCLHPYSKGAHHTHTHTHRCRRCQR